MAPVVNTLPANAGDIRDVVQSLGWEDPQEEGMATPSCIVWRIPTDKEAWWAMVHRVAKQLSSSSSSKTYNKDSSCCIYT